MFEFLICVLVGICVLMLCFVIFMLCRIFENTVMIRELEDKIDEANIKIEMIKNWIGDDNESTHN